MIEPLLAGRTVVVTRTRSQASALVDRLVAHGATVVELPVIAVVDPPDGGEALARAAHRLASGAYQWVACTSSNGALRFLDVLGERSVPSSVRWAAVGAATARTLADGGRDTDLVPGVARAEALVDVFPTGDSGTVLFPRAETVEGTLAAGLRAKGWLVDEVVAYRTVAGDPEPDAIAAAGEADAIAFASSSTVVRTVDLLGPERIPPLVVTIGPVTSETARSVGLEVAAEASPPSIDGLVDAVVLAFAEGRDDRGGADRRHRQHHRQQQQ